MKNLVILLGHVQDTPEIKTLNNGKSVANFTLVTTEKWKDGKSGEEKSSQERHRIAVFNDKIVETIKIYVHKGELLYIEGRIETHAWQDTQGVARSVVDIVVRPGRGVIQILGDRKTDDQPRLV